MKISSLRWQKVLISVRSAGAELQQQPKLRRTEQTELKKDSLFSIHLNVLGPINKTNWDSPMQLLLDWNRIWRNLPDLRFLLRAQSRVWFSVRVESVDCNPNRSFFFSLVLSLLPTSFRREKLDSNPCTALQRWPRTIAVLSVRHKTCHSLILKQQRWTKIDRLAKKNCIPHFTVWFSFALFKRKDFMRR